MSKFVVTPIVSSRLLLRETAATGANYIERLSDSKGYIV